MIVPITGSALAATSDIQVPTYMAYLLLLFESLHNLTSSTVNKTDGITTTSGNDASVSSCVAQCTFIHSPCCTTSRRRNNHDSFQNQISGLLILITDCLYLIQIFSRPYQRSHLCYSVASVICMECIVAKRCILEQKGIWSFPGWLLSRMVFCRKDVSPDSQIFLDRTFPGKTIPGWSLSRKDVSRVVIFPDETFPGKTS